MIHLLEMHSGLAIRVFELTFVLGQERAGGVEIVFFCLLVERQRVELATQGFVVAQLAPLFTKVCAFIFNAQVLMNSNFCLGECDF